MTKRVFLFSEGDPTPDVLGGKGANLAIMTQTLGLPIPQGFTITAQSCIDFLENKATYPDQLWEEVLSSLTSIEESTGKKFGDKTNPLLVSVRSGARISMPGMMDTVLNVGLNREITDSLAERTGNGRFLKDSFRRLIQMFANVVCHLSTEPFEKLLEEQKEKAGAQFDHELDQEQLDELITEYLKHFEKQYGSKFPDDPKDQLDMTIKAVFKSWNNRRAVNYRNHEGIPHDMGTAINVQIMVFGNFDENSGTGVLFSRNPASGEKEIYGEFLMNAQGEDVVAGTRTPEPIKALKDDQPENYEQLASFTNNLENHYRDMQDIEFTIEAGKLYVLQTRTGKRTGVAAAKIAHDMVQEGLISKEEAILRVSPRDVGASLFPSIMWKDQNKLEYYDIEDLEEKLHIQSTQEIVRDAPVKIAKIIGEGLPAGPGAACGHVVFDSDLAEAIVKGNVEVPFNVKYWRNIGETKVPQLILVKKETSPEDFHGMVASVGIVTMTGGLTSHAALVGRQIGKRVIVGAATSNIDLRGNTLKTGDGTIIKTGDIISIEIFDKGMIYYGELPVFTPTKLPDELETMLDWADDLAKLKVRANADKQNDTRVALDFKATGTGLARTEHQFFDVLELVQEMILAETKEDRIKALDKMAVHQKDDFVKLFATSQDRSVTIRLLDPPLHEFLPKELEIREQIWTQILNPVSTELNTKILKKIIFFSEANPMLGLRGCRLGLLYPEITIMQTRAIIEAALEVKRRGTPPHPEIMVPLISSANEFLETRKIIDETAEKVFEEHDDQIDYQVGTMIEIPRAALTADEVAAGKLGADFFSFGTNDLHQMTLGFSRDDVGKFLPYYLENDILDVDPFQTIDTTGTGKLMEMSVELGRKASEEAGKYLKVGICGEQGGDPPSIDYCYRIGLDYVSCSPYRVPIARLAAAHATLNNPEPDAKYGKKYPMPK
ncbi:MAG: pyruvate, phosphate dikinase [Candidatus Kariarchaeaceae archaeon]|jgi:pyruvate,orthophosphate dikinase